MRILLSFMQGFSSQQAACLQRGATCAWEQSAGSSYEQGISLHTDQGRLREGKEQACSYPEVTDTARVRGDLLASKPGGFQQRCLATRRLAPSLRNGTWSLGHALYRLSLCVCLQLCRLHTAPGTRLTPSNTLPAFRAAVRGLEL